LSHNTCDALLRFINAENDAAKLQVTDNAVPFDDRFGGVNCRGQNNGVFGYRQDMFLPMSAEVVRTAMSEAVTALSPLLLETVTAEGMVHEFSSFVADPGAPRQCIHADTIVLPCPQYPDASMEPLYTIFIALQDIDEDMGHTQFLPQTHTPEAHVLWNVDQRKKEQFLLKQSVVQSSLKKGDVSIFDSRLLHCGCANTSAKRRVLAYCTVSKQQRWPLPDGLHGSNSVRKEDRWKFQIKDLLPVVNS
jgi:ectoine hydroxylase-related dioxygenase (phytanoyl-CoA dioxygenase family)